MPQLSISPSGEITAIYSDELVELIEQGKATITRVSDVEPGSILNRHGWIAIMRESSNPIAYRPTLGPFKTRAEALAAEVAYLENKLF